VYTPPRKSYIPHPNIPAIPDKMLRRAVLMRVVYLLAGGRDWTMFIIVVNAKARTNSIYRRESHQSSVSM